MLHAINHVAVNEGRLRPILTQAKVEQQMLSSAKDGLLAALNWQTEGDTFSRKLSSLRFAARTFQEHLERALALEEYDGYMEYALELCPQFSEKIRRLRRDHDDIRESLDKLMTTLERLMPNDHTGLQDWREGMLHLFRQCDEHNERETLLIQDSFLIDYGGGD